MTNAPRKVEANDFRRSQSQLSSLGPWPLRVTLMPKSLKPPSFVWFRRKRGRAKWGTSKAPVLQRRFPFGVVAPLK